MNMGVSFAGVWSPHPQQWVLGDGPQCCIKKLCDFATVDRVNALPTVALITGVHYQA